MKKTFLIIITLSIFIITGCTNNAELDQQKQSNVEQSSVDEKFLSQEIIKFKEKEYDFGVIKQSGGKVTHYFNFIYNGNEPIEITGVPTSCACTSATINKTKFNQGESGVLTVKFNPNLHAEPKGKFFKTITFLTEPKIEEMPEVRIWAEIDLDLGEEAFELKLDHDEEEEEEGEGITAYNSITPEKFSEMLENKDFTLVDVHIPEQEHIDGTDFLIPYDDIESHIGKLPTDKDAKIVLYCRSGGMSRAVAYQLAEKGYTNVYDLVGGKNAYDEFLDKK